MRIDDMSNLQLPGMEQKKLLIQRQLGHKVIMPGAAQWKVYTEQKDECWICGHYIMTVFVWTPKIGKIAMEKDPATVKHFNSEIHRVKKQWKNQPSFATGVPYIYGPFTNWEPVAM